MTPQDANKMKFHRTCSCIDWYAHRLYQAKRAQQLWADAQGSTARGAHGSFRAQRVITGRLVQRWHAMAARTL